MQVIIALAALVCVALAAPQSANPDANAVVTRLDQDNIGVGNYNYAAETSNGIKIQESGQLKNAGTENESIDVQGQYSYPDPSGQLISVSYIANEDGFQPQGAHLPQNA